MKSQLFYFFNLKIDRGEVSSQSRASIYCAQMNFPSAYMLFHFWINLCDGDDEFACLDEPVFDICGVMIRAQLVCNQSKLMDIEDDRLGFHIFAAEVEHLAEHLVYILPPPIFLEDITGKSRLFLPAP